VTKFGIRLCVLNLSTCLYLALIRLLNIFKMNPGSSLYIICAIEAYILMFIYHGGNAEEEDQEQRGWITSGNGQAGR